ncbi:dUTP diphosphatase [archaeon]|jgi:dUTP pyrophosphatase|nr:dUTP diphosphatase [archaeon]
MVNVKIKKLSPGAKIPTYANSGDAGMDIYSNEDLILPPKHRAMIKTGISMEFPEGCVALVWDKSGIAKSGVTTLAGVGDPGYRGEYKIVLLNIGSKPYEIKKGEKIAQILIQKVEQPKIEEVYDLSDSERGSGGFGSSGLN